MCSGALTASGGEDEGEEEEDGNDRSVLASGDARAGTMGCEEGGRARGGSDDDDENGNGVVGDGRGDGGASGEGES